MNQLTALVSSQPSCQFLHPWPLAPVPLSSPWDRKHAVTLTTHTERKPGLG